MVIINSVLWSIEIQPTWWGLLRDQYGLKTWSLMRQDTANWGLFGLETFYRWLHASDLDDLEVTWICPD
jgi:hypothetical protein